MEDRCFPNVTLGGNLWGLIANSCLVIWTGANFKLACAWEPPDGLAEMQSPH